MITVNDFVDEYNAKGISLSCVSNYPWVYLESINGAPIRKKRNSEYGYVIAIYNLKGDLFVEGEKDLRELLDNW